MVFAPGPNSDVSMFETGDWTTWQPEWCNHNINSADMYPVDVSNDLAPGDVSTFMASLDRSNPALIAPDLYPSDAPALNQESFEDDVQMRETSNYQSRMDSHPIATSDFSNRTLTLPARNRCPTTEDWESYRPILTQLYRDENRTLEEVKSIMKATYGFYATLVPRHQSAIINKLTHGMQRQNV
jgi:hypothetical protein